MGRIRDPPRGVSFLYPDGYRRRGTIAEATESEIVQSEHGDYAARIELIEWEGGRKAIRFGYYRREKGKEGDDDWTWASRNTWVFSVDVTRRQIERAKSMGFFD